MHGRHLVLSLLLACVSFDGLARAEGDPGERDLATRVSRYSVGYVINPDGSYVEDREWAIVVLEERAVADTRQATIGYSTSIQKAEIKAAYTLKADGRRIDAPKSNYQVETSAGTDSHAPVFSDRTTTTVVFPEVAVGDTIVLSYRLTATQPMFAGHFSTSETFWRTTAYDAVDVRIDAPRSMPATYEGRQMKEVRNTLEGGRRLLQWHYENPQPPKSKRKDYSVVDIEREPGFVFSTFRSYEDIARLRRRCEAQGDTDGTRARARRRDRRRPQGAA